MTPARASIAGFVAALAVACGGIVPSPVDTWAIGVIPTDRPMIVSISTERAAWMWLVEPGPPTVLLRQAMALAGGIELIDPADCSLHDAAQLLPDSFTIRLVGPLPGRSDYQLQLDPDAPLGSDPSTPIATQCSGYVGSMGSSR
jgi:hypothetical protein